jgi:glycosyltransferase XagB
MSTPTLDHAAARPPDPAGSEPLIGDLLIAQGKITEAQRDTALATQRRTGSPLGSILVSSGALSPRELFESLALSWDTSFAADVVEPLRGREFDALDVDQLVRGGWVPVGRDAEDTLIVVTSNRPTPQLRVEVEHAVGELVRFTIGSEWHVSRIVQDTFRHHLVERATLGLWHEDPAASARIVLDGRQKVVGALLLVALVAGAVAFPGATVAALSCLVAAVFMISIAFKFVVCMRGARREYHEVVTQDELDALDDRDLPVYTVLVPCYREQNIVHQLVDNLGRLDYPAEKLQILLLLEADDHETIEAAYASNPPNNVTVVITPDGRPKTKPKACNIGLSLARGEYLVIFDAEDRPEPDQLKRAVIAFRKSDPRTVCLQAALNYFNADENVLTRMFTLEYSFWFDYMLPGLDSSRLPIPLGGTSNHFDTDKLRELGGWDPFNVTEDADLGIRASARGYRVGVVDSTTFEEANNAYGNWLRQRSRWIKGYMQTALVHLRHPVRLVRTAGPLQALAFLLLIGGTAVSFLAVLPMYLVFAITLVVDPSFMAQYLPGWVLWFSLVNLLLGNGLMIWVSMMGAFRRRRHWLVLWALLNPIYWIMHSIASYKALWQLAVKPHYWEKTTHGLSHVDVHTADGEAALVD